MAGGGSPYELDHLLDDVGQAEGEQQLVHVTVDCTLRSRKRSTKAPMIKSSRGLTTRASQKSR